LFLKGHIFINLVILFEGNKECHLLCGCNLLKSKVCIRRQDLQLLHKTVSKELHTLYYSDVLGERIFKEFRSENSSRLACYTVLTGKELTLLQWSVVPPTSRLGSPRREDEGRRFLRCVGKYLPVETV